MKRQQTTKPPVSRETTGRRPLHTEDFPRWNPSAPPKAPEELTWPERIVRKPDPRDEEVIREACDRPSLNPTHHPSPNHHPTLTPTLWSTFTPRHPDFISRRNLNLHPTYKKGKTFVHHQLKQPSWSNQTKQQMRDEFQQFLEKRLQTLEARFPTLEARVDSRIDERFKILENKLDTFCTKLRTQMGLVVEEAANQMQAVPLPQTTQPPSTSQTSGQQNGSMEECEVACDRICIMVQGTMVCLGTLQHLKNKFGKGCRIKFLLPDDTKISSEELIKNVGKTFPGMTVLNANPQLLEIRIEAKLPWSTMFQRIASLEKDITFEHVLVSDNTLEQLFIEFAQKGQQEKNITATIQPSNV
ncbi:hypothetical protein HPB49_024939 [Dermacentor silvarum]|uniref:Uncharacterized protein n=1 Tax=Dermacentor silvarum TaxID=543639 RepID=A0ACB8CNG8_DERSI|nr:hypothetical protein HPB49_024939 [Dermacentor silvarum]